MKGAIAFLMLFVASLTLLFALLFSCLQACINDRIWFYREYERLDISARTGLPVEDMAAGLIRLVDYMEGRCETIDILVTENGAPVSMYNERETLHMLDVRALYQGFRTVRNIFLCAAAALALGAGLLARKEERSMRRGYNAAAVLFVVSIAGIGIAAAADFGRFWTNFHYVFFTNDLWMLSYATDRMIRICPLELFYDILLRFGILFICIFAALTIAVNFRWLFRAKRKGTQ